MLATARAIQLERLATAGHRARGARAGERRPVCLRRAGPRARSGPRRGSRTRRPAAPRTRPARAWRRRSSDGGHGRVQRVAEELVAEVVEAAVEEVERIQERLLDQLRERRLQVGDRTVQAAREDLGHEAATDDGARAGDRARVVRQPRDRARAPRPRSCPARGRRGSRGRPSGPRRPARASSSSMWSGIPSVRSYTAFTTSRGAGRPVPRISVTTSAVSSRVRGLSRASSASRWLSSRARHSRWIDPTGSSSSR